MIFRRNQFRTLETYRTAVDQVHYRKMAQPIKSVHITNYYHKNSGGISTSFNNLRKLGLA